jgi:excisionase family DNA binding protein
MADGTAVARPSRPLTVAQVAHRLGCSARTVQREIARGKLRAFRAGSDWRVSPEALVEYQEAGGLSR